MVVDIALTWLSVSLLKERNLISETELNELTDVEVGLGTCMKIKIIPYTLLETETDIMTGLFTAGTVRRRIKEWTLWRNLTMVVAVIVSINLT